MYRSAVFCVFYKVQVTVDSWWKFEVSVCNITEVTVIQITEKLYVGRELHKIGPTWVLYRCTYLRNYWRYHPEILYTSFWILDENFLQIASNSEMVELESCKKFVELTRNDLISLLSIVIIKKLNICLAFISIYLITVTLEKVVVD